MSAQISSKIQHLVSQWAKKHNLNLSFDAGNALADIIQKMHDEIVEKFYDGIEFEIREHYALVAEEYAQGDNSDEKRREVGMEIAARIRYYKYGK